MPEISYLPGEGTVIVSGGLVLLVDAPADAQLCAALWRVAAAGTTYPRMPSLLESFGPTRLPALGLVSITDGEAMLLLRGMVGASVTDDVTTTEYADEGRRLYVEYGPVPAREVRLWRRQPAAPEHVLPLVGGVVRADAVLAVVAPTVVAPTGPSPAGTSATASLFTPSSPAPVAEPSLFTPAPPAPVAEPSLFTPPPPAPVEDEAPAPAPVATPPPPLDDVFVERPTTPDPEPPRPAPTATLADLWVSRSDTATAPPPPDALPAAPTAQASPAPAPSTPASPTPAPPAVEQTALLMAPPPPASAGPAPTSPAPSGVSVHATRCPNGHPNPPDAPVCRVCGNPIVDRELSTVVRPPLGRLEFPGVGWVTLDRDILIGSDPGAQPPEGPLPVLISHPAVSARHLEVRVRDWTVTVIDLSSQHGTSVAYPGRTPQPLHPRYPSPVVPGTVVWLAHQIPFTYLAT